MPTQVVNIAANSTVSLDLTAWINVIETGPANTVLNYGLKISSTTPIAAYYHEVSSTCLCNPEIFVLKGQNALGTDFWIPGQDTLNNDIASYSPAPTNSFDIIATQDFTVVSITPSHNIIGHSAGVPFNINLNKGQSYSATASSNLGPNHLCGSRVTSNYPIAITEKDDLISFTSNTYLGRDLIGDQIVPVNVLGTDYIPIYGGLGPPGDKLFITGTQTGTDIYENGTLVTTIGAGQTYRMSAPSPSCYIRTTHPAYVYQLSGIGSEVGSALLPQINCTGSTSVSFTQSSTVQITLNLLVKNGGQGSFLVNGAAGVVTAAAFSAVPGTGGVWYTAQVSLPVATYPIGTVLKVENTLHLFHLGVLNGGPIASGASFGYFTNYGSIDVNAYTNTATCPGDSIRLFATAVDSATYLWSGPAGFSSTTTDPVFNSTGSGSAGIYTVAISLPGCSGVSHVTVTAHNNPVIDLGNDTSVCSGASVTLFSHDLIAAGSTFLWNTGASTSNISVGSGTYWLAITDSGCSSRDTIAIQNIALPAVHLGNDTALCTGNTVTLTSTQPAGSTYLWGTGNTSSSIAASVSGAYWLAVNDSGCVGRDTISITFSPPPIVSLGPDTVICTGLPLTLHSSVSYPSPSYLWNTGSVNPTISASATGIYWLKVTQGGCSATDTIKVRIHAPISVSLGNDTAFCNGNSLLLSSVQPVTSLYTWSNGTSGSSILVTSSGTYWLAVTDSGCSMSDTIHISVSALPVVDLGHDTVICTGLPLTLHSSVPYTSPSYLWNTGAINPMISATATGVYWLRVTQGGCAATDTIRVRMPAPISVNLGNDTAFCNGNSLLLSSVQPVTSLYTWSNGTSGSSILVTSSGTYWLAVTDSGCSMSDTIHVTVSPPPVVNLGADTVICTSVPFALHSLVPYTSPAYLWNTGAVSASILAGVTGTYWLKVTQAGCAATDTIKVRIPAPISVNLGNDTAFCSGNSVLLSSVQPVTSLYAWSNGTSGSSILANSSGVYWLAVTDSGCSMSDTIHVTISPQPVVNLGPDTTACIGTPVILHSSGTFTSPTYLWSTGSSAPSISPLTGGSYWLQVTVAGCNGSDTVNLNLIVPTAVNLGNDTSLCGAGEVVLSSAQPAGVQFLWNAGSTADTLIVISTGTYWLETNNNGCKSSDTIRVVMDQLPYAQTNKITNGCVGDLAELMIVSKSGNAHDFAWDFGDANVYGDTSAHSGPYEIEWMATGMHIITLTAFSQAGCIGAPYADTVYVYNKPEAKIDISDPTSNNCSNDSLLLVARDIDHSSNYYWSPAGQFNIPTGPEVWANITVSGYYVLTVKNIYGCKAADSIYFNPDACCAISFPTAFTPNGDGKNDVFRPIGNAYHHFRNFRIDNRWGQTVFEADNNQKAWDGTFNNVPQDMDVYYYYVKYDCDGKTIVQSGDITLIR